LHEKFIEIIYAKGHENILATNKTTFEITKENHLTKRGDCIIAVEANKSVADLNPKFKKALNINNAKLTIIIEANNVKEMVFAEGNEALPLTHTTDMVVRKSTYICNRTLAIKANKAAIDLSRTLIEKLQNPNQKVKITLITALQTI
jgi:hypothetical protein